MLIKADATDKAIDALVHKKIEVHKAPIIDDSWQVEVLYRKC